MSGIGGFRGVSAVQDSRFSNKQAKLMKDIKFPKELDLKVDMKKVKWNVIRDWIAKRITELLGIEEEVLIGMVHNYFNEGKGDVDPKVLHMNMVPFLEKNTSLFMKELWSLLHSASITESGIPQSILDAKMQELKQKTEQEALFKAKLAKQKEEDAKHQEEEREARAARSEAAGADRPARNTAGLRDAEKEPRDRERGGRDRGGEQRDERDMRDRERDRYAAPHRDRDPYPRGGARGGHDRGNGAQEYDRRGGDYERDYRERGRGEGYDRRPERRDYVGARYRERDQRRSRSRSRSPPRVEKITEKTLPPKPEVVTVPAETVVPPADNNRAKRARPDDAEDEDASPIGLKAEEHSVPQQCKHEPAANEQVQEVRVEDSVSMKPGPEVQQLPSQEVGPVQHTADTTKGGGEKETLKVKKDKKEKKHKKEKKLKKEKKHKKDKDRNDHQHMVSGPDTSEQNEAGEGRSGSAVDELEVLRLKAREALKSRPSE